MDTRIHAGDSHDQRMDIGFGTRFEMSVVDFVQRRETDFVLCEFAFLGTGSRDRKDIIPALIGPLDRDIPRVGILDTTVQRSLSDCVYQPENFIAVCDRNSFQPDWLPIQQDLRLNHTEYITPISLILRQPAPHKIKNALTVQRLHYRIHLHFGEINQLFWK